MKKHVRPTETRSFSRSPVTCMSRFKMAALSSAIPLKHQMASGSHNFSAFPSRNHRFRSSVSVNQCRKRHGASHSMLPHTPTLVSRVRTPTLAIFTAPLCGIGGASLYDHFPGQTTQNKSNNLNQKFRFFGSDFWYNSVGAVIRCSNMRQLQFL